MTRRPPLQLLRIAALWVAAACVWLMFSFAMVNFKQHLDEQRDRCRYATCVEGCP